MSASVYYYAYRDEPMTKTEQDKVNSIADAFNASILESGMACEGISFYESDDDVDDATCILAGSTKPSINEMEMMDSMRAILAAITKLRRAVLYARWEVTLDDIEIAWDEDSGYSLPGL